MKKSLRIPTELNERIDCRAEQESQEAIRRWAEASEEHRQLFENAVERSAEFDRKVETAIEQVEIPAGLKQRLLAAVEQSDRIGETGISDSIDEALAAELVHPLENDKLLADQPHRTERSHADGQVSRNITGWRWTLGWVAATLLISLPAIVIHHALNPPEKVSQTSLARNTDVWLEELEKGLQANAPASVTAYPKCNSIRYGNLTAEGHKKIATDFGDAKASVWHVREGGNYYGKCITMTVRIQGRFQLNLGTMLPKNPQPHIGSSYCIAASTDVTRNFLHIVMVPKEKVYRERIWKRPDVIYTYYQPNSHQRPAMIAAENLPPEILKQLHLLSQPN